jgi:hypothetical protein
MDEPPKQNRSEMAAQLSNIAQFCDDLAFVIAGRGSAQNAAERRCGVHCTNGRPPRRIGPMPTPVVRSYKFGDPKWLFRLNRLCEAAIANPRDQRKRPFDYEEGPGL